MTRLPYFLIGLLLIASPALTQDADRARVKAKRVAELNQLPDIAPVILFPSDGEALGIHVIQGGVYEPSAFPTESWLEIACVRDDLTEEYNRTKHGSHLVRVHAILYDKAGDEFLDTFDTAATDEGICSTANTVDTTFIEINRRDEVGHVLLFFAPRATQQIEATEFTYRVFPR